MLITHIDYNEKAWKNNGVNEYADHQRMQYVPADGFKQTNSTKNGWNDYKGDLYPGITHNTQFTPSSNPSSFVFTGEMNKPIYDIEENEEIITFNYLESDNVGSNISNIQSNANNKNEAIYDLFGRKVNQPNKGQLYLKNGQKIIMP
jgi:hypothetical protein